MQSIREFCERGHHRGHRRAHSGEGYNKLCNSFYTHGASSETLSYSLQMGTRRVPDNNSVGFCEHWHRLLNCVGLGSSLAHSSGITYADYSTHSYAIGICCEALPHLASTGTNLSNTSTIHQSVPTLCKANAIVVGYTSRAHLKTVRKRFSASSVCVKGVA